MIASSMSAVKRSEVKENLLHLIFGGVFIGIAPLFIKLLLFLNNTLVNMLVSVVNNGNVNSLLDEVLKSTILKDEEYSILKNYLREKLGVSEDDLDLDLQIVIQAANGLKSGTENLQWLNENKINYANYSNYGTKWPLPGYTYLSSNYGYRIHPITGKKSFHSGIDIPAPQDTPVACPTNGVVVASYWNDYTGNTLVVRDQTYDYIFMHLYSVAVEEGQEVIEGQHLGGVRTTGIYSTGNHLHFAITKGPYTTYNYVNPLEVIAIQG